jgi:small subunit ribosomal protein S4
MKKIRLQYSNSNFYTTRNQRRKQLQIKRILTNYYEVPAKFLKGSLISILLNLEQRIDILLIRMLLTRSLLESRQWINHKFVKINNQIINTPSLHLKPNDVVSISLPQSPCSLSIMGKNNLWETTFTVPPYLDVDYKTLIGTYIRPPKIKELQFPFKIDPSIYL